MLRIAEARKARGFTQEQLANAIGTTQQTINRWECGIVDPQVSKIEAISKALGITVSFLMDIDSTDDMQNLDARETELVDIMRNVTPEGQKQLLIFARGIASSYPRE